MINLLAIETSGTACSVCLIVDGNRFFRSEHVDRRHNELLLPMLTTLREQAGLSAQALRERLKMVAFGCGPGSFTGVRIAAAAAQALALASEARIVRVPSSLALAQKALHEGAPSAGVITLIRSRKSLYYLAEYRIDEDGPSVVIGDQLIDRSPPTRWYDDHAGWQAVGAEPEWWNGTPVAACTADAGQIAELGQRLYRNGDHVDPAEGLPVYLEGDSPWRKSGGKK